ncbi:cysteine synthase family protein, partial [Desulfovibrio sp. OttesenSCG-928-G15]|nr:cysteine synthase family protein [Desulfovibrio sp. OttesenSCG-928-G15]
MIANSILDCIGNTPLVRLSALAKQKNCRAEIVAKLEYCNPGSSIKDRLALAMVEAAESRGTLVPHVSPPMTIVEPTSGNTGIGLALVAAAKGYQLVVTMPESMSEERKALLRGLGAELVLTPAAGGMSAAVAEAERLVQERSGAVMLSQFTNPVGPLVHAEHTGQEIWDACEGRVDIAVVAVGTGGTISGVGKRLKECNPEVKIYAVEPAESAVLSGGKAGPHIIQGIGAGFVPQILDRSVIDGYIAVPGEEALDTARELMLREGIFG